ncbi:hypothetical protein [Ornithinimicrobium flavum]|uniref:hypothetical protein n=1 Tax=Ornithinimicrobium flavum TaxID=1288636 RepID=UPI0013053B37|nr:hypothetical protein [Ornithinimicrobium flavum]
MSTEMSGMELAAAAVTALVLVGFVVGGVLAYTGTWAPLRRAMTGDPEGHRMAGSLWLGLLGLPAAALVLTDPAADGGLSGLHVAALGVMALLLLALVALALNRPAALTRALTPRWLLREREQRFGSLRKDGRPQLG